MPQTPVRSRLRALARQTALDAVPKLTREELERVRAAAAALPEKYRLPLALYYGMEMKVNDIARTLGLPVGTVKRRLHTARALVEKGLAENEN